MDYPAICVQVTILQICPSYYYFIKDDTKNKCCCCSLQVAANKYLKDTCGKHGTVNVYVTLGKGAGKGLAWGCDLSYDYVKINAEYTT